ncbi:hypothetical protein GIB67_036077 [Kingdonia uniflora]|uniref:Uncharacterized protein n=1 Tax=Kingdonia uniflora TaxID=39325 RepID=A0A7J7N903_9MAGN|nr:hypothetical protein GIB67_036077 [Kingdonia uniflora]
MGKALQGKILSILVSGGLLKDAYVVVKVHLSFSQDSGGQISRASVKKFAISFMKSGNINLINDVVKAVHSSGHKIDQV